MECEARERVYRLVIGSSVAFGLVSILAASISLPLVFNYSRHVQLQLDQELNFCQDSALEIWGEVEVFRSRAREAMEIANNRTIRQAGYGPAPYEQPAYAQAEPEQCEDCCIPGPKGTPGPPGRQGAPGPKGPDGAMGTMGRGPPPCVSPPQLEPCPECPTGPSGADGCDGNPGDAGPPGIPGEPGKPGSTGDYGRLGEGGPPGPPGVDGMNGDPGPPAYGAVLIPGDPGPPGDPGEHGVQGPKGPRGEDGLRGYIGPRGPTGATGGRGKPGPMGPPGLPGYPGKVGESGVCPTYCASDGGVFFEKTDRFQPGAVPNGDNYDQQYQPPAEPGYSRN